METFTALPALNIFPPPATAAAIDQEWVDFAFSSDHLRKQGAAPHGGQPDNETADCIEGGEEESAASKRGKSLPLIGGKGAVGADKADRHQKPPGGIQVRPPAQEGEREADD